jgi:hypothetical protein
MWNCFTLQSATKFPLFIQMHCVQDFPSFFTCPLTKQPGITVQQQPSQSFHEKPTHTLDNEVYDCDETWHTYWSYYHPSLSIFFLISVEYILKYKVLENHFHCGKKCTCMRFSLISPLVMHLEKHSRASCKAYNISFLTIHKYTSELVQLHSYK